MLSASLSFAHNFSLTKTPMRMLLHILPLVATLLLACGCSNYPSLAPVSGTVTYQGKPVANASVVFIPEGDRASQGKTDEQGKYELYYIGDTKGAVPGDHQVKISTQKVDEYDEVIEKETLPPKYNTKSTLTAKVEYGSKPIDFELE